MFMMIQQQLSAEMEARQQVLQERMPAADSHVTGLSHYHRYQLCNNLPLQSRQLLLLLQLVSIYN
jgi:hypothetical protein